MPQHTRRPPAPPAPEFYVADPQPPRAPDAAEAPAGPPTPRQPAPGPESEPRKPAASRAPAGDEPAAGWHQSEPWAVVMLASFALMLAAVYVPGTVKLVLVGLSAVAAVVGIVMLIRRGVFDHAAHE